MSATTDEVFAAFVGEDTWIWRIDMSDILGRLGGLMGAGPELMLDALAMVVDALGQGTEFTGDQVARLGELQQQLAEIMRGAEEGEGGE